MKRGFTWMVLTAAVVLPSLATAAPPIGAGKGKSERPTVDGRAPAPPAQTQTNPRPPGSSSDRVDCAKPENLICVECGGRDIACCWDLDDCEIVNKPPEIPAVTTPTLPVRRPTDGLTSQGTGGSGNPGAGPGPRTPHSVAAPEEESGARRDSFGRVELGAEPDVGWITSAEFASDIYLALVATELQISHTQEGVVKYGPPTEMPRVPLHKLEDLVGKCEDDVGRGRDPAECERLLEDLAGRMRPIVPLFRSWVRFGSTLRQLQPGLGSFMALQIPVMKSGDLRFFVNHLYAKVDLDHFKASIGDGGLNLSLAFDAGDPAILCGGTGGSLVGLAFDALCPDVRIRDATVAMKLAPAAVAGAPSYTDARVDFEADVDLAGIRGEVASAFVDADAELERMVETQLREILLDRSVKEAISKALKGLVAKRIGRLSGPIADVRVIGSRLQIRSRSPRDTMNR